MAAGLGSSSTIGPLAATRRRLRKERLDEDDSSDLSDESDEEGDYNQRPAGQVRFGKMPVRHRADSSPIRRPSQTEGPPSTMNSPSKEIPATRHRAGSLNAVDLSKPRMRRDTITSSEVSSENEQGPATSRRRRARPMGGLVNTSVDRINEEEAIDDQIKDAGSDSDDSLASGFSETLQTNSLLVQSSPLADLAGDFVEHNEPSPPKSSPRKVKSLAEVLQDLPPTRPISTIKPISALSQAIQARNKKPTNILERFAGLTGSGDSSPLYIKLYVPSADNLTRPLEVLVRKTNNEGEPVTVAAAIGFCMWKYGEEKLQPPITDTDRNVNRWVLRIVEDGDIDDDFPPLGRTRPIVDFTFNNNRPARTRAREKPWDEVALIRADATQFRDNEKTTPIYSKQAAEAQEAAAVAIPMPVRSNKTPPMPPVPNARPNPITGPTFMGRPAGTDGRAADLPTGPTSHATERNGAPKSLKIHFTNNESTPLIVRIDTTTDSYLAEVFDTICKKLNIDKALYMLKVTGTGVVAPSDRTVEALGPDRSSLDLVRKRFIGDGNFGLSGSPGSTSPNAPLHMSNSAVATPGRRLKKIGTMPPSGVHPLAQQYEPAAATTAATLAQYGALTLTSSTTTKRYNVIRKQPMSFTPSHARVLVLDGEYIHLLPGEAAPGGREKIFDPTHGKITSIHCSSVVGCKVYRKHPKTFRIVVFREKESKRYDFEAGSQGEAEEIVENVKRGMEPWRDVGAG